MVYICINNLLFFCCFVCAYSYCGIEEEVFSVCSADTMSMVYPKTFVIAFLDVKNLNIR